jgi:hypothetical protein
MASVQNSGDGKFKLTISMGFSSSGKRGRVIQTIKVKNIDKDKAAILEKRSNSYPTISKIYF